MRLRLAYFRAAAFENIHLTPVTTPFQPVLPPAPADQVEPSTRPAPPEDSRPAPGLCGCYSLYRNETAIIDLLQQRPSCGRLPSVPSPASLQVESGKPAARASLNQRRNKSIGFSLDFTCVQYVRDNLPLSFAGHQYCSVYSARRDFNCCGIGTVSNVCVEQQPRRNGHELSSCLRLFGAPRNSSVSTLFQTFPHKPSLRVDHPAGPRDGNHIEGT